MCFFLLNETICIYDTGSPDYCNNEIVKATREPVQHIIHVGTIQSHKMYYFLNTFYLLFSLLRII